MFAAGMTGAVELRYIAGKVRKARIQGLRTELGRAQRKAFEPLAPQIRLEALATLPSGYGGVMANALRLNVRRSGLDVTARIWARGRAKERDVAAVNRGLLRHPRFGDRGHWYAQRVRPGFVERPVKRLEDRIAREALGALEKVRDEIMWG